MEIESRHKRVNTVGYLSVLGGFLVQMTLGGIYTYDNMAPYVINYMKNYTISAANMTVESFWLWIFDLTVFGFGSSMALGGFIETTLGAFLTVMLGGWLMSIAIIVCYWTIKIHLILFATTHGLLAGIGAGIAYSVSMAAPIEWFPHSQGFITGILVSGFGLGPLLFDFMQAFCINGNVATVVIKYSFGVPISFIVIGTVYGTIQILGGIIIKRRRLLSDDEECSQILAIRLFQAPIETNVKPHQLLHERDFWILWISYCLNSSVSIMILTLHKMFGVKLHFVGIQLTWVAEIAGLCNGFGRILWGYLIDKISYKVLMSIVTLLMSLMIGTFYLCSNIAISKHGSYAMYFIWVALLHVILGGNYSIFPAMCVKQFGVRHFASNYGILFTAFSFGAIVTSLLTFKLLEDDSNLSDFKMPFIVGCLLSLTSLVVTQFHLGKLRHIRNNLDI